MAFDFSPESLDREFPVRRNLVYFNHAAVAPLPRRVADAITAHTENVRDRGAADPERRDETEPSCSDFRRCDS